MELQDYIDAKLVHEIHTSERKNFRSCRRRWDWSSREAYYPKTTAKPLEFGTAYHAAMEILYSPERWNDDREVVTAEAIMEFVRLCNAQRDIALADRNVMRMDEDVEADYAERVELGKGMISYYAQEVSPRIDAGWTPLKVEIAFMVPIRNFETGEDIIWCKCSVCKTKWCDHVPLDAEFLDDSDWDGLPMVLAGRIDAILQDAAGNVWIVDWKTTKAIFDDMEFLEFDDQVGSYTWALNKLGLNIAGFIYHEQRKGFPTPPEKLKRPYKGCMFSTSKSQDTDYNMYLITIMEEDNGAYLSGNYDAYLKFLQHDGMKFHERTTIYKTENELDEIERNLCSEALEMSDPQLRVYPSPSKFGCKYCVFKAPCAEKNNKGDFLYTLNTMFEQRAHYYDLAEATTDSD